MCCATRFVSFGLQSVALCLTLPTTLIQRRGQPWIILHYLSQVLTPMITFGVSYVHALVVCFESLTSYLEGSFGLPC